MMRAALLLFFTVLPDLVVAAEGSPPPAVVETPALRGLISFIDDVEVPAERAGVLKEIKVREGDALVLGAIVALIDPVQAALEHAAAQADLETAQSKAVNELDVKYAEAEHRVRNAEHEIALVCNAKQANSVSLVEVERLRLAAEQAHIKIGVSLFERSLRAQESRGFDAKTQLAAVNVERRTVTAPLAGEVAEVFFRPGEWVEPGKPILRLVRLDRLRLETFVRVTDYLPHELVNRPISIQVTLARGRRESFLGRVTFVNPAVQPGGDYRVWAEVDNRRDAEQWLLRPGMEADVVLESKTAE